MAGSLLISGNPQQYNAIGEGGRPVFSVAFQLREAVRLKAGSDVANCLAIPQSNETGSVIDWYAPQSGSVVSWAAATVEEREHALNILDMAMNKLNAASQALQEQVKAFEKSGATADPSTREKSAVFQLMNKVFIYPDPSYIFLVNGNPVLTFWGFHPHGASLPSDPFQALRALPPVAAMAAEVPVRKGVSWWWWLLLISLLLLLLFFGLRSCDAPGWLQGYLPRDCQPQTDVTRVAPVVPPLVNNERAVVPPTSTPNRIEQSDVRVTQPYPSVRVIPSTVVTVPNSVSGTAVQPNSGTIEQTTSDPISVSPIALQPDRALNESQVPIVPEQADIVQKDVETVTEAALSNVALPNGVSGNSSAVPAETPVSARPEVNDPSRLAVTPNAGQSPTSTGSNPNAISQRGDSNEGSARPPGSPLRIPDSAANTGSTGFLDGSWSAGAGIQDATTGRPVRLEYDFSQGNGQGKVTVNRGAGIQCTSPVTAQMQGKNVQINDRGLAKCSDGSTMALPKVTCVTNASGQADCQGRYDNGTTFPVSMRHAPK